MEYLAVGRAIAYAGSTARIPLSAYTEDSDGLGAYDATVNYDPERVEVENVVGVGDFNFVVFNVVAPGVLKVVGFQAESLSGPSMRRVELARITFRAVGPGGISRLYISGEVTDTHGETLLTRNYNGFVWVV